MGFSKKKLESVPFLDGADLDITYDLLKDCPIKTIQKDEILIKKGDTQKIMYLLLDGELRIHLLKLENQAAATIAPGECVGEIAILDNKPRSAFVVGNKKSNLLEINQDIFWTLLNSSHEITFNLLLILSERLRGNNKSLSTSLSLQKQLRTKTLFDGLTGLHNKRWITEVLPRQVKRAQQERSSLSACMIDIDYFKKINDTYGHLAGDYVLSQVAKCFGKYLRPTDFSARYGGEEFLLVFLDMTSSDILKAAERIRKKVSELKLITPSKVELPSITISLGLTQLKQNDDTREFLKRADKALYQAKDQGRNQTILAP